MKTAPKLYAQKGFSQPTRATDGSSGHDIYAPISGVIPAGKSIRFDSGVYAETDSVLTAADVRSRSGWAWNYDVVAFCGLIDHDYSPNTIGIKLFNFGDKDFIFSAGERVAQITFPELLIASNVEVVEKERTGGFGSTGR